MGWSEAAVEKMVATYRHPFDVPVAK
jgi:hypothetical protein